MFSPSCCRSAHTETVKRDARSMCKAMRVQLCMCACLCGCAYVHVPLCCTRGERLHTFVCIIYIYIHI